MRLPPAHHAALPWRIAEIAPDFELIDAWALPVTARADELGELETLFSRIDPTGEGGSRASAWLFALRRRLGDWFGWDRDRHTLPIPGCRETSLRERLPAELRGAPSDPPGSRFRLVYRTPTEWAREVSNNTVHAVLHVGWVPQPDGDYRAQLGVYVKPRGRFGPMYMAAIAPFRHHVVYPAMLRQIGHLWRTRKRYTTDSTAVTESMPPPTVSR